MSEVVELLKRSGYSHGTIEYYTNKVNIGKLKDQDANFAYSSPCGDAIEFFLKIDSG